MNQRAFLAKRHFSLQVRLYVAAGLLLSAASGCFFGSVAPPLGIVDGREPHNGDKGSDYGTGPGTDEAPLPLPRARQVDAVGADVYVNRVKALLTSEAVSSKEVKAVQDDPNALGEMVDRWMKSPTYKQMMTEFFKTQFQQDAIPSTAYQMVYGLEKPERYLSPGVTPQGLSVQLDDNIRDSLALTVMAMVESGQPFSNVLKTEGFMMTPALMSYLAFLDAYLDFPEASAAKSMEQLIPFRIRQGQAVANPDLLNRSSPNFMVFSDAGLLTTFPCLDGNKPVDVNTFIANGNSREHLLTYLYYALMIGSRNIFPTRLCNEIAHLTVVSALQPQDYTTWKWVTVTQTKNAGEVTDYYDIAALRATNVLKLRRPQAGFLGTPAFQLATPTNASNQMRVTVNQSLIIALGRAYDGSPFDAASGEGFSAVTDLSPVEAPHASRTECFVCHKSLDPARQFFLNDFGYRYETNRNLGQARLKATFSYGGPIREGQGIKALAQIFAQHPKLAEAWTAKLCAYVNAGNCDVTAPAFKEVVAVFQGSGLNWNTMARALFTSPLITFANPAAIGQTDLRTPLVQAEALRQRIITRMGREDWLAAMPQAARVGLQAWPQQRYERGQVTLERSNNASMMLFKTLQLICTSVGKATQADAKMSYYLGKTDADVKRAIGHMAGTLLGLQGERGAKMREVLNAHFSTARAMGLSPEEAMHKTFLVACASPYMMSDGL